MLATGDRFLRRRSQAGHCLRRRRSGRSPRRGDFFEGLTRFFIPAGLECRHLRLVRRGRQIIGAIFLVVLVKILESSGATLARSDARLWPLVYLPTLAGLVIPALLLTIAARPGLLRRKSGAAA